MHGVITELTYTHLQYQNACGRHPPYSQVYRKYCYLLDLLLTQCSPYCVRHNEESVESIKYPPEQKE